MRFWAYLDDEFSGTPPVALEFDHTRILLTMEPSEQVAILRSIAGQAVRVSEEIEDRIRYDRTLYGIVEAESWEKY